jgi:hypothetical protein
MANAKYDYDELATRLWESLDEHPSGLTIYSIMEDLDIPRQVAYKTITTLRLAFGGGIGDLALPCVPQGRERVYKLDEDFTDTELWMRIRQRYSASRILTELATFEALYRGLDGRTVEGRTVRRALMSARNLKESFELLLEELEHTQ